MRPGASGTRGRCVGSFGGRLQREREMRGISLDEIAEATKIGTRSLRALECEDFEKLPGGIFNKGFVRAYAKYLGIDEEQAVSDYMAAIGEKDAALGPVEVPGADSEPKIPVTEVTETGSNGALSLALVAVLLVVIAALGMGAWKLYRWRAERPSQAASKHLRHTAPAATQPPAQTASEPALPTPTSPWPPAKTAAATQPTPAAAKEKEAAPAARPQSVAPAQTPAARSDAASFELLIHAREDSWMSITADGKPVMSGILKAAAEKSIRAKDKVVLKIGNAGGVEISHNGKPVPALGEAGQTRTVTFTPGGIQQ